MAVVLCIDSSPGTIGDLRNAGHTVQVGSVGLMNGIPELQHPPHEADLIICDLKDPACYDSRNWGPGGNDNYRASIVPNPTEEYVRGLGDGLQPRYRIIHRGQMAKLVKPTFGPRDVLTAVDKAGVPAVLFLNHKWLCHVDYDAPNIFGVSWRFNHANASKLTFANELVELLGKELLDRVSTPLKFAIAQGPFEVTAWGPKHEQLYATKPLVSNAIGEIFGQQVMLEKGSMWVLPGFEENSRVALRFLEQLPRLAQGLREAIATPTPKPQVGPSERDVFISHASEDKPSVARPLAEKLRQRGISVWFDEYELVLGDRLREKIDAGLKNSRFGVTILSHAFFSKSWPQSELDGLLSLERGTKRILPVWHELKFEDVRSYSPILSGRLGISTDKGIDSVVAAIERAIRS